MPAVRSRRAHPAAGRRSRPSRDGRRPRAALAALLTASTLLFPALAPADIVLLRNGREIQGDIVREDEEEVVLRFPGGTLRLRRRDIAGIRRQSRLTWLVDEGRKALRRGDPGSAIELLQRAAEEHPDSSRARSALAEARRARASRLLELRRHEEAIAAFRRILERSPSDGDARAGLEAALEERATAREQVERALEERRSGDAETALARLERVWETYPDLRERIRSHLSGLYVTRGAASLRAGKARRAAELLRSAVEVDPARIDRVRGLYVRSALARIEPLAREGDFAAVEPIARDGLGIDPASPRLGYWLAVAREASGEEEEARRLYTSLLGRGAPEDAGLDVLRRRVESDVLEDGDAGRAHLEGRASVVLPGKSRTIRTTRFVVRHWNHAVGREVARVAERSYADLFGRLGCRTHWRNPCEIVIYPRREEYLEHTPVGPWSDAAHRLGRRRGVFTEHRIVCHQEQTGLTSGVLQHEIAHALLAHRLNYPESIPLWANEGFAVAEGPAWVRRHYRGLLETEHRRRHLLPVERVLETETYPSEERVALFYAQSHGLVAWLLDHGGVATFVAFLKDLTRGERSLEAALAAHYRLRTVTALENRWHGALLDAARR